MKLSKLQQSMFWGEFARYAACYHAKDKAEQDAIRKELILKTCGKGSLTEVEKGLEFDVVLHTMAIVTGNTALAERTANGNMRRMVALVYDNVKKIIGGAVGTEDIRRYCAGILRKRGMEVPDAEEWYTAIPPATLLSLVKITSIAAKRIKNRPA